MSESGMAEQDKDAVQNGSIVVFTWGLRVTGEGRFLRGEFRSILDYGFLSWLVRRPGECMRPDS